MVLILLAEDFLNNYLIIDGPHPRPGNGFAFSGLEFGIAAEHDRMRFDEPGNKSWRQFRIIDGFHFKKGNRKSLI